MARLRRRGGGGDPATTAAKFGVRFEEAGCENGSDVEEDSVSSLASEEDEHRDNRDDDDDAAARGDVASSPAALGGKRRKKQRPLVLTDEKCRELWYQADEIATFKDEAKDLVLTRCCAYPPPAGCGGGDPFRNENGRGDGCGGFGGVGFENADDLSGLHRYRPDRARHKRRVLHYVLSVQDRLACDPAWAGLRGRAEADDVLGGASRAGSAWAVDLARREAWRDRLEAYPPPPPPPRPQADEEADENDDGSASAAKKRRLGGGATTTTDAAASLARGAARRVRPRVRNF